MIFLLSCLTLLCQEMVYARISNAEALRSIKGMTALGGGDSSEESPEAPEPQNLSEPEPDTNAPGQDFGLSRYDSPEDDIYDKVGDIIDNIEDVTPIKSMKEVVSMQEVKSMTPLESVQEVKSIQEIKSIEEIKEHIARDFIKDHGLKNPIDDDDYGRPSTAAGMLQDLEDLKTELKKDSKKCNILRKEIEKKMKE